MRKRYIATIIILLMIIYSFLYELYGPQSTLKKEVNVIIPTGIGSSQIANILARENIIQNTLPFKIYLKLTGKEKKLNAGRYKLNTRYSIAKIAETLSSKELGNHMIKITIPEGYDLYQISQELENKELVNKEEFLKFAKDTAKSLFQEKYTFLDMVPTNNLEGYLYPNTYLFSYGESKEVIMDQFLKQFATKMMPIWEAAPTRNISPKKRFSFHNIVTMASIIEKEAQVGFERPIISSVYYNRLKKLMPLAADPTVVYALGKSWKKIVRYKDLKIDSPYNTYKYSGFPPTPIASPGTAAFKAALNPAKTDYFFFVANKDGTHSFTKTYREHINIQKKKRKSR